MLVIDANQEVLQELNNINQIFYIYYLIILWTNINKVKIMTLIVSKNKINIINFIYIAKLSISMQKTNINLPKIDDFFWKSMI